MYDRRFATPRRAWLHVDARQVSGFWHDLMESYLLLAIEQGWGVSVQRVETVEDAEGARLEWSEPEVILPPSSERQARRWLREQTEPRCLLGFVGPRAAALLSGERGRCTHHSTKGTLQVDLLAFIDPPPPPPKLAPVKAPLRTWNETKDLVVDHVLELHRPLEPRWHRLIARFAQARLLVEVFGREGLRWAKRWGERA
jgi:hypothetical protein